MKKIPQKYFRNAHIFFGIQAAPMKSRVLIWEKNNKGGKMCNVDYCINTHLCVLIEVTSLSLFPSKFPQSPETRPRSSGKPPM